jgi:hypothetical protein
MPAEHSASANPAVTAARMRKSVGAFLAAAAICLTLVPAALLVATPGTAGAAYPDNVAQPVNFGSAGFFGPAGGLQLNAPDVGMAPTPSGQGYWIVASD